MRSRSELAAERERALSGDAKRCRLAALLAARLRLGACGRDCVTPLRSVSGSVLSVLSRGRLRLLSPLRLVVALSRWRWSLVVALLPLLLPQPWSPLPAADSRQRR